MVKTMILRTIFISYLALISLVSVSESDPLTEASINGFTTELIHRDSPQSPSYDPSLSPSKRLANALKRSFNRVERFKARRSRHVPVADVIPTLEVGEYLMKYSVGTPPVPSLAIADTGSDVIWTQCQPCVQCFNQSLPFFNPKSSSTYRKIRCNTTNCNSLPESTYCSRNKRNCLYLVSYGDNSFTNGQLASETFLIGSGRESVSLPKIKFGCGTNNGGIFSGSESGIIGLGGGKASLIRQLGRIAQGKFSYCLTSFSDHSNSSEMQFGVNAEVSGREAVSTPLVKKSPETFYYLTLEGISVGNQRLNHSSADVEGNIIIDSGTTLTLLPADLYAKFEKAIKSSIKLKQIKDPEAVLSLCYFTRKDDIKIPNITVHFRGADVKWNLDNAFVRMSNDSLCLAAQPRDFPIYGNLAQTNFLVAYDLGKGTVSFKPTDCGK